MFKFLHAADIHLDSPLRKLQRYEGAPVEDLRNATRRALENLVDLAIHERVAFVLIAGDLYDGDWTDYGTGLFLNAQMVRLRDAGIPAFVIRGNHDAQSLMTRDLRLPDNVKTLSTKEPETVEVEGCGALIHGQGFDTRAELRNLAERYPDGTRSAFNIGILHTSVNGREGHESYAPCTVENLRSKSYQYWALGHIHKQEIVHDEPHIVFPGNIQGRHPRETGAKGCMLVTVENGEATVEPRTLDVLRWHVCDVDACGVTSEDELLERIDSRLHGLSDQADGRLLAVRVSIRGACPAHGKLVDRHDSWVHQVRADAHAAASGRIWVEKVALHTTPERRLPIDDGPIGEVLAYLDELKSTDDSLDEIRGALKELRGKVVRELRGEGTDGIDLDSPDTLRSLLDDAGMLLVEGLTGSTSPHDEGVLS